MTSDQATLFGLLFFVFVFLIWGRWRYDLVAFVALMIGLLTGVVPADQAFSGFGHPATVIIALVLVISRGLSNSGVIELLARYAVDAGRKLSSHVAIMSGLAAALSAVMNNVAALALLMPVDLQAAKKSKRSPSLSLMPLSFASILGGMITMIGTPPNIIIAKFRGDALGESYSMFDFAPVGLACASVGVAYVALIGWRLLPADRRASNAAEELFDLADYVAEAKVKEGSPVIGKQVRQLDALAEKSDVEIVGLVRRGRRVPDLARTTEIKSGDLLVIEASPDSLEEAIGSLGLEYVGKGLDQLESENLMLSELVVSESSRLAGRSAMSVRLLYRYRVALVGVSRQGEKFREKLRKVELKPGDVILLLGDEERLSDVTNRLGLLPLADRGQRVIQREKVWLAVGLFVAAGVVAFGLLRKRLWTLVERQTIGRLIARLIPARFRKDRSAEDFNDWLARVLRPTLRHGGMVTAFLPDVVMGAIGFSMLCASNAMVLRALGSDAPLILVSVAVMLGYFAGTLVGAWGGIGVTEAALAALGTHFGVPAEAAAAGALLHRAVFYAVVLSCGGGSLWVERRAVTGAVG